jgi:biotin carboxyl carrier protein
MAHGWPHRFASSKLEAMKLTAKLSGKEFQMDITRQESRVVAEIDGRRYEIEAHETAGGIYLLLENNRVSECRVEQDVARREVLNVHVGNESHAISLLDPKRLRATTSDTAHTASTAQLVAPMPGKVVRVLVEQGASVKAGETVVVVEAMKMQNEMKSPRDGTVTTLKAVTGATVNAGDVLAIIEANDTESAPQPPAAL